MPMEFDEAWYVSNNPDVAEAIKEGRLQRGFDHYLSHGRSEGRLPSLAASLTSGEDFKRLTDQQTHLGILDELGIKRLTDKSSLDHDYLRKYERLFAPFRDSPITVLEIGIFDGASLKLWEDYFPRATIVGLDIKAQCREFQGGRRIVEIASQSDEAVLKTLGERYWPTIIIDDGSHRADHIFVSFESLYPVLRKGGLYIVEDVGMHTGLSAERHRGNATISPQKYFLKLANQTVCPRDDTRTSPISLATDAVEFFENAIVIKKKPEPELDPITQRRALVERINAPEAWGWFAGFILSKGGSVDEAIACARRAIELAPNSGLHHFNLSLALEKAGRLDDALSEAKRAQELSPGNSDRTARVARLLVELNLIATANDKLNSSSGPIK
jgi:tetratricopeptide (TPR) repeat protein